MIYTVVTFFYFVQSTYFRIHLSFKIKQMTFLSKKNKEAEILLLKIREAGFSIMVTESKDDYNEFIEHFYVKILQSKALHINDNNKWKVIEISYEDDVFSETVEKMFERNNFTDRKINLAYETSLISDLRYDKTNLLKIYQTFHFAYKFNYLFCLDLQSYEPDTMQNQISKINHLFLELVESKKVPIYFLLGLDQEQMEMLESHLPDIFEKEGNDFIFRLPKLNPKEIQEALEEFPIYTQSNKEIQNEIVENIYQSDNTLLQIKNVISKFKAGIIPKKDLVIGKSSSDGKPLQIKKDKSIKPGETTHPANVRETEMDALYNSLGTRFQRETLCKILLKMIVIEDDGKFYANDCLYQLITENLHILEKDISNSLKPFVEKKIISFNPDRDDSIRILKPNALSGWPMLRQMIEKSKQFDLIFEKLNQISGSLEVVTVRNVLNADQLTLINSDDTEFFVSLKAYQFQELDEKVSIIRNLSIEIPAGSENLDTIIEEDTSPNITIKPESNIIPEVKKTPIVIIKPPSSKPDDLTMTSAEEPEIEIIEEPIEPFIEDIIEEAFTLPENTESFTESTENMASEEDAPLSSSTENFPETTLETTDRLHTEQDTLNNQESEEEEDVIAVDSPIDVEPKISSPDDTNEKGAVPIKLKIGIHRQGEQKSSEQKTIPRPTISIKRKE